MRVSRCAERDRAGRQARPRGHDGPGERLGARRAIDPGHRVGGVGRIGLQRGVLGAVEAGERVDDAGGVEADVAERTDGQPAAADERDVVEVERLGAGRGASPRRS